MSLFTVFSADRNPCFVILQMRTDMVSFPLEQWKAPAEAAGSSTNRSVLDSLMGHFDIPDTVRRQVSSHIPAQNPSLLQQCWHAHDQVKPDALESHNMNWSYARDLFVDVGSVIGCEDPTVSEFQTFCYSPATCSTTIDISSNLFSVAAVPVKLDFALIVTMQSRGTAKIPEVHTLALDDLMGMFAWARSIRNAVDFFKLNNCADEEVKNMLNCHHTRSGDSITDNNYYGDINYMKEGKLIPCNGQLDAATMILRVTSLKSNAVDVSLDLTHIVTLSVSRDFEPLATHVLTANILSVSSLPAPKKKKQLVSSYIVVRAKGNDNCRTIALTDKNPYWDMDFAMKLSVDQLDDEEYLKTHGFCLFLFSGPEGQEEIIGQSFLSYKDLLPFSTSSKDESLCTVSDLSDVLYKESDEQKDSKSKDESTLKPWQQLQFDIFMDMDLSIAINVHSVKGLLTSRTTSVLEKTLGKLDITKKCLSSDVDSDISHGKNNYYVEVGFVTSNGDDIGDKFKYIRSKKVSGNAGCPQFNEVFYLKAAEHGMWCAHFIRIVIKEARWIGDDIELGEILISLDDVCLETAINADDYRRYDILPTAKMKAEMKCEEGGGASSNETAKWDLGDIFLGMSLRTNKKSHTVMTSLPKVMLRSSLRQVDPYCTQWTCVGVTAREHVTQANSRDQSNMFKLLASPHCLKILDSGDGEFEKQQFDAVSTAHQFQRRYVNASQNEAVEVRLFELQRRALLPPHEFDRKNLLYTDAFEFSDHSGSIKAPYSPYEDVPLLTPSGFVWEGDWTVDTNFPGANGEGWYSGFDITLRKRCWVRRAVQRVKKNETIQLTKKSQIHIFENQRRSHFPPYNFGLNNSLPFERGNFSDETGAVNAPYKLLKESEPPEGYEWDGEWEIDLAHTNTDADGWSYGREYIDIMCRYKLNQSSTTPGILSCCRRRRWKRNIRLSDVSTPHKSTTQHEENFTDRKSYLIKSDDNPADSSLPYHERMSSELQVAHAEETGAALANLNALMADELDQGSLEVHIFENQRRSAFPPYEYGPGNYLPFERRDFSDESGKVNAPYKNLANAIPPDGYDWDGDWEIDYTHIQTEVGGWSYGTDYTAIMREYVNKTNRFSRILSCCRRRRWKRKVRPKLQRVKSGKFSVNISVDLAKQLATEYANKVQLNKDQEDGSSDKILESCKEKDSLMSPISIPWHQVIAADVVSPTVLAIRVKVHRFFGSNRFERLHHHEEERGAQFVYHKNDDGSQCLFHEVEVDFYVLNCPAFSLMTVIRERMYFSDLRGQLCKLAESGLITGDVHNPYNLQAWSLNCEIDEGDEDNDGVLFVANDLSLGSQVAYLMDSIQQRLSIEIKDHSGVSTLSQVSRQHVENLRCRILAYMAVALELRVKGPSFKTSSVRAVLELDTSVAERYLSGEVNDKSSVAYSANGLTGFFLDVAETRIRDICICGLDHLQDVPENEFDLRSALSLILHQYYASIIALLGTYFNSKDALLSVQVCSSTIS